VETSGARGTVWPFASPAILPLGGPHADKVRKTGFGFSLSIHGFLLEKMKFSNRRGQYACDKDQTGDKVTLHAPDSSEESEAPPLFTRPDPISLHFLSTYPPPQASPLKDGFLAGTGDYRLSCTSLCEQEK
ncbi:hypothetical protein KUCAC02_024458, partial [Chaenocephalus aceratus]